MYTTITKLNGVIYFSDGINTEALTEVLLQTAKISYDLDSVFIAYDDEFIKLTLAEITSPVVATTASLVADLMAFAGLPFDATVVYGTPINAVAAQGTLTLTAGTGNTILTNKTVTVGGKVYTFKTVLTPTEGQVLIGANDTAALANILAAINHTGTPNTDYKCAAVNANVTGISSNATTLIVENKVKGVIGNSSAVDTDIAGAWDDTTLGTTVAGVDGTAGGLNVIYKYGNSIFFTNGNTIADANWVEFNADILLNGQLWADVVNEKTDNAGVTVDTVLLKDGLVKTSVGTAAAPAYTFASQTDMGMYKSSSTELAFAAGGVFVARVSVAKGIASNLANINQIATGGVVINNNTDPADKAVFASDLIAAKIFTGTPVGNINYTLPTGTELDTANALSIGSNYGVTISVINLSANTITFIAAAAATIVGGAVVAANTSAQFRLVRAAANTFVLYRLS